ncbi:MAG: hypothetical protein GOU99_00085 [Candidatus Altiarchaeota archaeon]|nr:hypothetical protein [Candidatus Altiarchaeota archaeon]
MSLYDRFGEWYSLNYRKLLIIPVIVFILTAAIFFQNYQRDGEFFKKDIDLSGGTIVTIYTESVSDDMRQTFEQMDISVREIKSYDTSEVLAIILEAGPEHDPDELSELVNASFSEFDVRHVGPAMGKSFMTSAKLAIALGFIAMGLALALTFKKPIVALTVILSGGLNVFEAAALMTQFGVKLAPHTIGALLMLMGWSVDSEVLFDTKILKDTAGDPKERALQAMKTAMTMSAALIAALLALYYFSTSKLISDIALVLLLGAIFDIINTWFQSLSMVLWYVEAKK